MQGMGWDQNGWLFSLDGFFVEQKENVILGWAMQGMAWDQDGWLFSSDDVFVEWKENNIRGRHAGMGWDQDGGLKSNIRMGHARDGMRSGRMPLFIRRGLSKRKVKSY